MALPAGAVCFRRSNRSGVRRGAESAP